MNQFDDFLKVKAREETEDIPDCVIERIEQALSMLPEREHKTEVSGNISKYAIMAAGFLLVFLIIPSNVSTAYAQALKKVPVISNIVKVVTIRNYFYSDDNHEMNVNVPKIEDESSGAAENINKDIDEMTEILVGQFYEEIEEIGDQGHGAVYTDYSVLTNTNLNANRIAITVTTMSFLEYLPVNNLIKTYAIAPTAIPFEIE